MTVVRARAAVSRAKIVDASPFAAADALAKEALGCAEDESARDARLAFYRTRQPGSSRNGEDRYRWELSHKRCPLADHIPPLDSWRRFRPDINHEMGELALSLPISIPTQCEWLERCGDKARWLLDEAAPIFRRDVAQFAAGTHAWVDTFGLYCIARHEHALERLRPIALAIATSYAAIAEGGVKGTRFPYTDKPLASATAHLAAGLYALGAELPLLASLLSFVRSKDQNGAFGDGDQPELLTTLVCAHLLARLDPAFDPTSSATWILGQQDEDGLFRARAPEAVWLTAEIVRFLEDSLLPFSARFRFPHAPRANLDRKTGLPFYAYFDDLAHLFSALPGLSSSSVELVFLDLAGFRAFNNACGQDAGDAVLGEIAHALEEEIENAAVVRDGGDEYLIIGAPTRAGLASDLDAFRKRWPRRFRARFGTDVPVVSARILALRGKGSDLRAAREKLGQSLAPLKHASAPGIEGLLVEL